jgi:hypothetical protein
MKAAYRHNHPEVVKAAANRSRQSNREKVRAQHKKYYEENKERIKVRCRVYQDRRRAADPLFKLSGDVRSLIWRSFKNKGWRKSSKTQEILGCDFETLQAHLIQTAKANYGGKYFPKRPYHVDHIVPVSSSTTEEELIKLNHYTNLQYLYPQHNRQKSDKLDWKLS